jgi:protein disulfide-isomerase
MNVEIWSDVACPFCYIGKRHFEKALESFAGKDDVKITWRSFELDPNKPTDFQGDVYDHLSSKYGVSRQRAIEMNERVLEMANNAGLTFNLDKARPTNSFDAHRIIQLAKKHGLQSEAEEAFFAAYFTKGLKISDKETLKKIGEEIGLGAEEIDAVLSSEEYKDEVRSDESMATQFGISGVPFFVFERKYGVSGAQPVDVFQDVLENVATELANAKD